LGERERGQKDGKRGEGYEGRFIGWNSDFFLTTTWKKEVV
jgi:hypothetical protein